MMFPVTRLQLRAAIETYGFITKDAERIITDLEGEGRIDLSGSMLEVNNPTDYDAQYILGLCEAARGGTARSVGNYKVKEYLQLVQANARKHGSSSRV